MNRIHRFLELSSLALAAIILAAAPRAGIAQTAPAPASTRPSVGAMPGMDHGSMAGMTMASPARTSAHPMQVTKPPQAAIHHRGVAPANSAPAGAPSPSHANQPSKHDMPHASMQGMSHAAMPGMDHGSMQDMQGMSHGNMAGMDHGSLKKKADMDHGCMHGMEHGSMQSMSGMPMGPMQGGIAPPDARDPDYSAGTGYGATHGLGMAMEDRARFSMLLLDQLEAFHGKEGNGQRWEAEGWYGNDYDKLWLRSEGERVSGVLEDGDLEALWSHTVATFWSTQLGVRADAARGPNRTWAAFGIQGLTPFWFELEATGYVDPRGRTAARLRVEYELFLTQRLILQPELETNLYGKADPARHLGAGLSDVEFGMRLRYEIRREFAPYLGVVWARRFGGTADFTRAEGRGPFDRQWVAGFRIWY